MHNWQKKSVTNKVDYITHISLYMYLDDGHMTNTYYTWRTIAASIEYEDVLSYLIHIFPIILSSKLECIFKKIVWDSINYGNCDLWEGEF